MKTINFQQQKYEVPNWANFIARDEDGKVCVYETKPEWLPMASSAYGGMWRRSDGISQLEVVYHVVSNVVACEAI